MMSAASQRTVRHQQVAEDTDSCEDEGAALRRPAAQNAHAHGYDYFCRDVDGAEDDLDEVDVHTKFLQVHGETVVGETCREPERKAHMPTVQHLTETTALALALISMKREGGGTRQP